MEEERGKGRGWQPGPGGRGIIASMLSTLGLLLPAQSGAPLTRTAGEMRRGQIAASAPNSSKARAKDSSLRPPRSTRNTIRVSALSRPRHTLAKVWLERRPSPCGLKHPRSSRAGC